MCRRFCVNCTRILFRIKSCCFADGDAGQHWLAGKVDFLKTLTPIDGKAAAFVCENYVCKLPVTDAAALRAALK